MIIEDQCLGLVRSLGLVESNSANLRLGGRFRLKAHARDICSQAVERYPSASLESIEAGGLSWRGGSPDRGCVLDRVSTGIGAAV